MKGSVSVKRCFILFLSLLMIFSLASCGGTSEETTAPMEEEPEIEIPGGSLSVPYVSSDPLNPYFCESVANNALTSLVYRYLYRLDTSFTPVKDLAKTESLTGLSLKVYIVPDLVFSDGSLLSAEDVCYSFMCAKSSRLYSGLLGGISSCEAEGSDCVVFSLKEEDINVLNCLIFPIVKNGTAASAELLPVGNGFYQFSQDGIRLSLKANLRYWGALPEIGTVRLTDIEGNTAPENLVATTELDFFYTDLSDSNVSTVNCAGTGVYLNNLVYLGINHNNVNLGLFSFRQALSYAIDRQSVAENAFRGYARGAAVPFNTSWSGYTSCLSSSSLSFTAQPEKTQTLLSERGFGADGTAFSLRLLCGENSAFIRSTANEIAASLKPFNIDVAVSFLDSDSLERAVRAGEYDMYIAEIKLPDNMELSAFFSPTGAASWGMRFDVMNCDEAYFRYKKGEISLDDFIAAFNAEMPFIPLVYRNGRFLYTRDVTSALSASEDFFYSDINKWSFIKGE
ncbi:MAG: hypothetical protein E7535_01240 [Ruminococcaceae bacterium]|nr:hypothetical protein [Oscillospiraceae bacterium]